MKKVVSISGGKTSAFIAANYEYDDLVFALVRTEDEKCRFKDDVVRKQVEDRIGKEFVGTLEDDMIIYTILDLEQYLGREVNWVSGITFDKVVTTKGGWIPNKLHRYCTENLKIEPIFNWWRENHAEPVEMMIGFRANEVNRAKTMLEKVNADGFLGYRTIIGRTKTGNRNRWGNIAWQKSSFPLIEDGVFKDEVERYWEDKPIRFAFLNNCVGCFHRNAALLKMMSELHPEKLEWFADQEGIKGGKNKGYWKENISYRKIIDEYKAAPSLFSDIEAGCGSGFCGIS